MHPNTHHSDILECPESGVLVAVQFQAQVQQHIIACAVASHNKVSHHLHLSCSFQDLHVLCCVQPVGIANTVAKYQEHRPLEPRLTPFEARVEAKMAEEEVVRASVLATSYGRAATASSLLTAAVEQQLAPHDKAFHDECSRRSNSRKA